MNAPTTLTRVREQADSAPGSIGEAVDAVTYGARRLSDGVRDTLSEVVPELSGEIKDGVRQARRELAGRLDPDGRPRRRRRWLLAGLVVTAVSALVWAVLSRRPQQVDAPSSTPWPVPATPPGGTSITGDPAFSAAGGPASRNGHSGD
ncbi:hypothetical protein [Pseudonocardia acidicola]|uniref:DUF3618 domain-containing protein n=1 Tax=Pseudonocardia acidicola TaxID=2724939 RepID=A0ABX1SG26_9PSEU|nr:hypothetical protein [Pseudonocardia acidicola]NMI00522.1 hypothetical protein [Pseudonocardia acidicola]